MICSATAFWRSLALSVAFTPVSLAGAVVNLRDSVPPEFVAAPYYPAPHGGWLNSWKDAYSKAEALVSQMTLAEKTNVTSGIGIFMGKLLITTFTLVHVIIGP